MNELDQLICDIKLRAQINSTAAERPELEQRHGQIWDTDQLRADFEVQGFLAPQVVVRCRADNQIGSLEFQHFPRYYFCWKEDTQ